MRGGSDFPGTFPSLVPTRPLARGFRHAATGNGEALQQRARGTNHAASDGMATQQAAAAGSGSRQRQRAAAADVDTS